MTGDEVLCCFCGRNVWWGSEDGPCEHLLADWALDPNDNGGGVLGEMLSRNEGIAGAEALGKVSGQLCAWVWSAGNEAVEARLRLAANAVVGKNAALWAALHEAMLGCYDREAIIECYGADASVDIDPIALAADFANPMAEAVVQNLAGISVTYEILGGMTSGTSIFVWSDDPLAGRATIEAAVASAIKTVEIVVATLDGCDS